MNTAFKQMIESHLPPRKTISLRGEADFYGISRLIAARLGKSRAPKSRSAWQHGWVIDPVTDPRQIVGDNPPNHRILVANQFIANYLRHLQYDAVAVGLPMAYTHRPQVDRIPNSLLVMPAHVTKHSKNSAIEKDYVDFIAAQVGYFDQVLVCVSQQCADRGFWVDAFARSGLDYIVGAGIDDLNALQRIRTLLSQFETMTTNAVGSHSLYAGFSGCRVSLSGPEHPITRSDLVNEPFYAKHPDLIDSVMQRSSRTSLLEHYPHLGLSPRQAETCAEWAEQSIGLNCIQKPEEIARLLRWGRKERIKRRTIEVIQKNWPGKAA